MILGLYVCLVLCLCLVIAQTYNRFNTLWSCWDLWRTHCLLGMRTVPYTNSCTVPSDSHSCCGHQDLQYKLDGMVYGMAACRLNCIVTAVTAITQHMALPCNCDFAGDETQLITSNVPV